MAWTQHFHYSSLLIKVLLHVMICVAAVKLVMQAEAWVWVRVCRTCIIE
jgi:hypothetical protein